MTFNGNGLPMHAGRVDDLLHAQRPDGLQLVARLYRAISLWREPNEVPSGVAREEFRSN